jgi:hypothetical protein
LVNGIRVSTKEFKILNVPAETTKEEMEKAIFRIIKTYSFHIKKSRIKPRNTAGNTNTVFFSVNDDTGRHILKNTWSIKIGQNLHILAPASFSQKDFEKRKYYRGEFFGFDYNHQMPKVMEVLAIHNPMHVFRQTEDKVVVEFKTIGELFNACEKSILFDKYKIRRTPRGANWIQRDEQLHRKHNKIGHKRNQSIKHKDKKSNYDTDKKTISVTSEAKANKHTSATGANKIPIINNRITQNSVKGETSEVTDLC